MEKIVSKRENGRKRVQQKCTDISRTEQSHVKDCSIKTIMAKAKRTGMIPVRRESPLYGDFTSMEDYHSNLCRMQDAMNDFMGLSSKIRKRFNNDPGELIEFLNSPDNLAEAVELGILKEIDDGEGSKEKPAAPAGAPVNSEGQEGSSEA